MYDLIIVGAGPAGSSAGRIAGQLGLNTLLLEKDIFPRYKACGGALSKYAMSHLDFEIPENICEKEIFGARVKFGHHTIEKKKNSRLGVLVTRSNLDNLLLQKAKETGIKIKQGEEVKKLVENANYIEVFCNKTSYKSKYVIVAEGATGKLKYSVREKERLDKYGLCLVTEVGETNRNIDSYIYNSIFLQFGVAELGYGWIFPHDRYYSIGIGGMANLLSKPRDILIKFLKDNGFNDKIKINGHIIPVGGLKRKVTTNRILLCGDSAGFVDSFIGEGIAYAIRSGQIATEIVSRMKKQKSQSDISISDYSNMCHAEFGEDLKYSLLLTRCMHKYPNVFLLLLASNERVINKFLDIVARNITYKDFFIWLIPRVPVFLIKKFFK